MALKRGSRNTDVNYPVSEDPKEVRIMREKTYIILENLHHHEQSGDRIMMLKVLLERDGRK